MFKIPHKPPGAQHIDSQPLTQTACRQKGARGFSKTLKLSALTARSYLLYICILSCAVGR